MTGTPTFKDFFDAYSIAFGARRDGKRAERVWNRLSAQKRKEAFDGIDRYKEICRQENKYMCYAQGYLNQERWEDDPSIQVSTTTNNNRQLALGFSNTETNDIADACMESWK